MQLFAFEISYVPPGVFAGEPLAFRLQSAVSETLSVRQNGVDLQSLPVTPEQAAELRVRPREAAEFDFTNGTVSHRFRLVRPDSEVKFVERDGYLEQEGIPVILLPDHRKPPPLDRRWETLQILRKGLQDNRPPLGTVTWIRPETSPRASALASRLQTDPVEPVILSSDASWYFVHSVIRMPDPVPVDFLVIELDEADLERGVSPHEWRMKWQFALQRLQARTGYRDGLLLGPVETPVSAPWLPMMREELQSLARSHGLRFVDRSLPEPLWLERILNRLVQEYTLP